MTTTSYKKKLIEVAMPLEAINKAAIKEKSNPFLKGHPRSIHQYWARRPITAARGILFAQLVDDPSSHPEKFTTEEEQQQERDRLFHIMEELIIWENSTNEEVLKRANAEILKSAEGEIPTIYDPFSGGGSIPMEAQRLGLPACGSDLNPVAVMIGKAMIEIPPLFKDMKPLHPGGPEKIQYKNAEGLAEDVRFYSAWMHEKITERIEHLYPRAELPAQLGSGQANVVAWIWARTVPSPDPAFQNINVPLVSTFVLSSRAGKRVILRPIISKEERKVTFEVVYDPSQPEFDNAKSGNKVSRGGNFTCMLSGASITADYIKEAGKKSQIGQQLIGIVGENEKRKVYISANNLHEKAANINRIEVDGVALPDKALGFSAQLYGNKEFEDLFSNRQLFALSQMVDLNKELYEEIKSAVSSDHPFSAEDYAKSICVYIGLAICKLTDYSNMLCSWNNKNENIRQLFSMQTIPMSWDFAEVNLCSRMLNIQTMASNITHAFANLGCGGNGFVFNKDAKTPDFYSAGQVISTDPPYYDNIAYADLSDFFYGWMKKLFGDYYGDLFSFISTPKEDELIADQFRRGSKENAENYFTNGMTAALQSMASLTSTKYPSTIYYAFKQSEIEIEGISSTGWATFITAVIRAGYSIVGTWPMRMERESRTRGIGSNALATSIVLVCRKREVALGSITRAEFIRQLKTELPTAIADLKAANIAPADIPQSSIGPGIGIFSRYQKVLESDDSPMSVKTALQLINRELGEEEGDYDPETSFALTWFEQNGFNVGNFGMANNLATAKGIAVNSLVNAGIAQASGGKFGLFNRDSLKESWDPADDSRVTIWECCQYLIRRLENRGEFEAAKLMKAMGSERAEAAKELAYALYDIAANKRRDATEATAYNGLIAVWSELSMQAANVTDTDMRGDRQGQLI